MQICISVCKKLHPNTLEKIQEIRDRGGSISGELAVILENSLDDSVDAIDKMAEIVSEMTDIMRNMRLGNVVLQNEEVIHENTQNMLGNMMFGFADDEEVNIDR